MSLIVWFCFCLLSVLCRVDKSVHFEEVIVPFANEYDNEFHLNFKSHSD
jgi:hypothetical protein